MKIKPILFNTEMVRAILDGRKSCTRRIVKPQPQSRLCYTFAGCNCGTWGYPSKTAYENWGDEYKLPEDITDEELKRRWNPPYHTDDILYVRETWRVGAWDILNQMIAFDYKDGTCGELTYIHDRELFERLVNQSRNDARQAKCEYNGVDFVWEKGKSPCRWHPSIHMPKKATRIWLKVTDVRVERLQEIDEDGVWDEGFKFKPPCLTRVSADGHTCDLDGPCMSSIKYCDMTMGELFGRELWNSTIKKSDLDRYGWNANPWVWTIEYERCEKPEGV